MPLYRATVRFGSPHQQYHVQDLTANSLREAMRMAVDEFPEAAIESADLVEVRRQREPEERDIPPE